MSVILNQLKISNSLNMIGGIYSSVTEAIRIMQNNGYISIYNTANDTRTGYIQGNTGSNLTIAAENGASLLFTTAGVSRMTINTSGVVSISATTASSSTTTGALVVSGGVGIAGAVYTGGNISATGTITATSSTATGFAASTTTGAAYTGSVSSGTDRYFLSFTGAVNSFSLYENSNTAYINSYSSMIFRANQLGGSSGSFAFSGGNVGIGTTSPASLLHLSDINTNPPQILLQTSNSSANGSIFWRNSSNSNNSGIASNYNISDASGNLEFLTGGATTRMTINSSGNVGIGVNPSYKLDVAGAGSGVVGVRLTPDNGKVRLYNYDLLGYNTVNLWLISNGAANQLTLGTSWDWDTSCDLYYTPSTVGAVGGSLVIGQTNKNNANFTHGNTIFYTNGAEKVRVTRYGTLIVGDGASGDLSSTWWNNGIGLFGKNGTDKIIVGYLGSSTNGALIGAHNSALNAWAGININASTITFRIGETSKMLIDASGNVSISSTTASTSTITGALTVSGGVGIAGILSVPTLNIGSGTFSFKNYTWNSLGGPDAVGGNRYEIARICIDYNDWNSVGVFEVELFENYYGSGLKKKYNVYYGFTSNYGVKLVEYQGSDAGGANNFRVTTSGETTVTGDQRYISVYVDVKYYGRVAVRVTTNRQISTSNPPAIGYTYINSSPSATSISDFTADTVVEPCQAGFINITGNLGLGTSSPNAKISVGNNVSTGSIDAYSKYQIITYDGGNGGASYGFGIESNTMWFNSGGGAYKFYRGGSNVSMYMDTSGNIGIGTTSVDQPLAFADSVAIKIQLNGSNANGYQLGLASAVNSGDAMMKFIAGETAAGEFGFYNTTNLRMLINKDGNVGIGVSSPSNKLVVNGGQTLYGNLTFGSDQTAYLITGPANGGAIRIRSNSAAATDRNVQFGNVDNLGSWSSYMIVDNGGNVGIGTTSPGDKLTIAGVNNNGVTFSGTNPTITSPNNLILTSTTNTYIRPGSSYATIIDSGSGLFVTSGNVGIGTASPTYKLVVNSTTDTQMMLDCSSSGFTSLYWANAGSEKAVAYYSSTSNTFRFGTMGAGGQTIISSGTNSAGITLDSSQNTTFAGKITISSTTDSSSTTTGSIVTSGGVGVAGNIRSASSIYADGNLYIANTLTVTTGSITLEKEGNVYPFNINVYSSTQAWHAPRYLSYRARGTKASPTGVATGDELFSFQASALDNNGNIRNVGNIILSATGTVSGNNVPTKLVFQTCATTAAVDALTLDNNQNGTFAAGLTINGSLGVGTAASGTTGEIRATNNITAYYSDERLKTKLGPIKNPIQKVKSLSGFYFSPNNVAQALGYKEGIVDVGVSAQEVNAILPEIIAPAPIDPKYMTVRYEKLIPLLIEAIKEQQSKIEELENKLSNLDKSSK